MPLDVYPNVHASGSVPTGWVPIKGRTIKYPVRNDRLRLYRRGLLAGKWHKVIKKGNSGEIHQSALRSTGAWRPKQSGTVTPRRMALYPLGLVVVSESAPKTPRNPAFSADSDRFSAPFSRLRDRPDPIPGGPASAQVKFF
jgi:hypothetical protein